MKFLVLAAGIAGGFMLESLAVMLGVGAVHDSWWPQVPLLGFGDAVTVTVALIFVVSVFRGVSAILEGVAEAK